MSESRWIVTFAASTTTWVEVYANSEAAARAKAEKAAHVSVCHQCARDVGDIEIEEIVDVQRLEDLK